LQLITGLLKHPLGLTVEQIQQARDGDRLNTTEQNTTEQKATEDAGKTESGE
jgi:hypothetical protein